VAGIETQTDIALCVTGTVAREVVGRDGSILLSGRRSFRSDDYLNGDWCSDGSCNWWGFNFGESGEETEEQTENARELRCIPSQGIILHSSVISRCQFRQ